MDPGKSGESRKKSESPLDPIKTNKKSESPLDPIKANKKVRIASRPKKRFGLFAGGGT